MNVEVEHLEKDIVSDERFQVRIQYALEMYYIDFPVEYLNYKSIPVEDLFSVFKSSVSFCCSGLKYDLENHWDNKDFKERLDGLQDDIRNDFLNQVESEIWYCDFCGGEQRYSEVADAWFCPICEWER